MFLFENIYTRTRYKTKTWKEKKDRKRKKISVYYKAVGKKKNELQNSS